MWVGGSAQPFGRYPSISAYTRLSLSLNVRDGMRSPHSNWPVSSTCLVDDTGRVHADQRLLYAFPASAVAFDYRGLEQGALQFRHLELEPAGLGGQAPVVVAGPVRLPSAGTLVHGRSWRISLALASSIALSTSDAFCVTSRSSLAPTCAGRSV